jgi:hypothetical protein
MIKQENAAPSAPVTPNAQPKRPRISIRSGVKAGCWKCDSLTN